MNALRTRLGPTVAALSVAMTLGLAACGGDDSSSESSSEAGSGQTAAESSVGPSLDTVLSCLQDAGLAAEEQSTNTSGETIGIDYPGGRTVISFEENEEDAELAESVQPDPSIQNYRAGLIVVSPGAGPAASADQAAIETCISG